MPPPVCSVTASKSVRRTVARITLREKWWQANLPVKDVALLEV
jgi:hypothetical protein